MLKPTRARNPALRKGVAILQAVVTPVFMILVAWHYTYIPLHLLAHEHFDSYSFACKQSHDGCTDEEDHDGHVPHAASDHLTGFWTVCVVATQLDIDRAALAISDARSCPDQFIQYSRPLQRGPPALL